MSFIYIIITAIVIAIMLAVIFKLDFKKNKIIAKNTELNNIAQKLPNNYTMCEQILKKLNNENVKIEEDSNAKDCLYIAITNKIIISKTQDNFTRIQTIAHECLHSIQDKRIQISNFIISNICIIYYIIILLLAIFNRITENAKITTIAIYILLGMFSFAIRAFLENDAMIKAQFLAEEYLKEKKICNNEEIEKLVKGFTQINYNGIKGVNFSIIFSYVIKIIILACIFIIT